MTQFTKSSNQSSFDVTHLKSVLGTEGSTGESRSPLFDAVCGVANRRRVSFHMPGHKSRLEFLGRTGGSFGAFDLDATELAGLDDLSDPVSVIAELEQEFAQLYKVRSSFLSLGGSSHGLIAALLSLANKSGFVLVPRNAHRSILNGLVLSGHELVWYEPEWQKEWGVWDAVQADSLRRQIESLDLDMDSCVALVVVSPTYSGAISDIKSIKSVLKDHQNVRLIVDEAHGAHLVPLAEKYGFPPSAVSQGADLVAHSTHKTLPGLTQTGLVHIPEHSSFDDRSLRAALGLVTSSSPSYPLMISMELITRLMRAEGISGHFESLISQCERFRSHVRQVECLEFYQSKFMTDPFHMVIKSKVMESVELIEFFESKGVFVEANLGAGTLLLVGLGTESADFEVLSNCIEELSAKEISPGSGNSAPASPVRLEQSLSPRTAYLADFEFVPIGEAVGRISAECISPCPPGVPVLSPGALVPSGLESSDCVVRGVRVVK